MLENFVIHPESGSGQRTDGDIFGIRFQYRRERLNVPMVDDPEVSSCATFCNFIIAEVKRGECALNTSWTDPSRENMHRALRAIGCFEDSSIDLACEALYSRGTYKNDQVTCSIIAFGDRKGSINLPDVRQILYGHVIGFIHKRFKAYQRQKSSIGNWAADGQRLRTLWQHSTIEYEREIRRYFGLPAARPEALELFSATSESRS
jgi:hypothetical protein